MGRSLRARWGMVILPSIGLIFLILAVAGPRWPDPGSRLPTEGISIALVVDASFSMTHEDFLADGQVMTRWQAVQKTARLFVQGGEVQGVKLVGRPNDLIALVTFAQRPETDCPPTLDHESILALLEEEAPRGGQGTNPGDAIAWALHLLSQAPTQRKVIVFLSDGEDNVRGGNLSARQAAQMARGMNVPIYAVEIEPVADAERPEDAKLARANMEMLAKETDGLFLPAKDTQQLAKAYAAIDELERERIVSYHYRRYHEGEAWFASVALIAFLLLVILKSTRWRTTP